MNNKILIFIIIGIIVVVAICGLFLLNDTTKYARKIGFENNGQLLAVFYLENIFGAYDYTLVNEYFTEEEMDEFDFIDVGGEECYFIVPRYNMDITISSLAMNEDGGTEKEEYVITDKPFFLNCNMSDIFSNSEISFEYKGKKYEYSPYISLKDGSVVSKDFTYLVEK